MDFSASQSKAHALEYAALLMDILQEGQNLKLSPEAADMQHDVFFEEARNAQQGCLFHFKQSARRLEQSFALISKDKRVDFSRFVDKIISVTNPETFDQLVSAFRLQFHAEKKVHGWLNWFLRPNIAKTIFPACQSTDRTKFPKTTNAIEHSHSLLHHATGTKHDLIQGILQIVLHVSELKRKYYAIKGALNLVKLSIIHT
jgi:hypothetical protein